MGMCRWCGASVIWAKTQKGKWISLSQERTLAGNVDYDALTETCSVVAKGGDKERHMAHTVTCEGKASRR